MKMSVDNNSTCPVQANEVANSIAYATSFLGVVAIICCLLVIAVIFGYAHDHRNIRDRLLLGLFSANCFFALGSAIPYDLTVPSGTDCGVTMLSVSTATVGQAFFLGGNYVVVGYEVLIMITSVLALQYGVKEFAAPIEVVAHILVIVAGIVVFSVFCNIAYPHLQSENTIQEMGNDDILDSYFEKNIAIINDLEMRLFRWWLMYFTIVLFLYLWLNFKVVWLVREWNADAAQARGDWNKELWDTQDPTVMIMLDRKQKLLNIRKEAFWEVTKPLRPYMMTFIIFGIPSIVLATDLCQASSNNFESLYQCEPIANLILTLRSSAMMIVYFQNGDRRRELLKFRTLLRKIHIRCSVISLWCFHKLVGEKPNESYNVAGYRRTTFSSEKPTVQEFDPTESLSKDDKSETVDDGYDENEILLNIPYNLMSDTQ